MTREEAMELVKDMTEEELILFRDAILDKLRNSASPGDHQAEDQVTD